MAKLWQLLEGHSKPPFSEKVQRGDQGKFFKNRLKSKPCLRGRKAVFCKWYYRLISMRLKGKVRKRFWRKQRLEKCPNGQVTTIFARSPKIRIFWKSAKGYQGYFFKNRPKSSLGLKGPKALCRKWHYSLICIHLKGKNCRRFGRKRRLQKCPNNEVMPIFERSPKTRIFWKSAKGGTRQIFQKSPKK